MGIFDILAVLGVFFGFGYIILAKIHRRNPEGTEKFIAWITKTKEKMDVEKIGERRKQT